MLGAVAGTVPKLENLAMHYFQPHYSAYLSNAYAALFMLLSVCMDARRLVP